MISGTALVSSPAAAMAAAAVRRPRRLRTAMSAARSSSGQARRGRALLQPQQRLVAAQSPPPLSAGEVRREAELGLASVAFVLTVVMGSFLSLVIISIPARSAFKRLEVAANKLSKVVSEEVPGTLSSLKLSCLEINDLMSQLKNLRERIPVNRSGRKSRTEARSQSGRRNPREI